MNTPDDPRSRSVLVGKDNQNSQFRRKKTKAEKALEAKSANSAIHDMLRMQGKQRSSQYSGVEANFGLDSENKNLSRDCTIVGSEYEAY